MPSANPQKLFGSIATTKHCGQADPARDATFPRQLDHDWGPTPQCVLDFCNKLSIPQQLKAKGKRTAIAARTGQELAVERLTTGKIRHGACIASRYVIGTPIELQVIVQSCEGDTESQKVCLQRGSCF